MNANPFAGMNETRTNQGGGVYLSDGRFKLKIQKTPYIDTPEGTRAFIAEMSVSETTDAAKHPVGSNRSFFQGVNKSFKSEVKAFCYAACGYDEKNPAHAEVIRQLDSRSEAIMLKAIGPLNIFAGREVFADVKVKPQKLDPTKNYTKHVWSPASPPIPLEAIDKALALP